jgi:hypothetical protein
VTRFKATGINIIVAAGLVAAIGDIRRLSSPQKLVSYVGLNPRVRQSGLGLAQHGRISKRGRSHARAMSQTRRKLPPTAQRLIRNVGAAAHCCAPQRSAPKRCADWGANFGNQFQGEQFALLVHSGEGSSRWKHRAVGPPPTTRCSVRPTAVTRATEKSGLARATRLTGCPFLIFARERQTHTPSSAELRKALARFQRYCLWLGGLFFVSCSLGNCMIFIGTCSQRRVSAAITQLHQ